MNKSFQVLDDNRQLFDTALEDISKAQHTICFEIYRFNQDSTGEKYAKALIERAKAGVKIKLLVDAWGSGEVNSLYKPMLDAGINLRIYHKLVWDRSFLSKNHCRNHRKLLIIDSEIAYIGSSNLTTYSLKWRELNLRISRNPELISVLTHSFNASFRIYNRYSFRKRDHKRDVKVGNWLFVQDLPNPYKQNIRSKYEAMIDAAYEDIVIETPYFLPGFNLRKKLIEAAQRGVKVTIIMPYHSDVHSVDIIRRHYLGILHQGGVTLQFYNKGNLHAKCVMIDGRLCSISSANFDYRSFRYQYELALIGNDELVLRLLQRHIDISLLSCQGFDYKNWLKRSPVERLIEWILLPFRFLF
ncbi:MAG: phosphatidylserine/phosphatidylglycerophosphate/cardiolipin synthase family protein [Bacteroidales bacterium]|jgi:cardiolipin synthase|nr:phosphatidylserine/phosphatidylglycerophosphate/cardiolipin synthase family protein [Bacteroidales bacterium]